MLPGVDEETKAIVAVDLTTGGVHDSPHLPAVLDHVTGDVGQVSGDTAYDGGKCYQAILARGALPTIPPRRNARLSRAKDPPPYVRRVAMAMRHGYGELDGSFRRRPGVVLQVIVQREMQHAGGAGEPVDMLPPHDR